MWCHKVFTFTAYVHVYMYRDHFAGTSGNSNFSPTAGQQENGSGENHGESDVFVEGFIHSIYFTYVCIHEYEDISIDIRYSFLFNNMYIYIYIYIHINWFRISSINSMFSRLFGLKWIYLKAFQKQKCTFLHEKIHFVGGSHFLSTGTW